MHSITNRPDPINLSLEEANILENTNTNVQAIQPPVAHAVPMPNSDRIQTIGTLAQMVLSTVSINLEAMFNNHHAIK